MFFPGWRTRNDMGNQNFALVCKTTNSGDAIFSQHCIQTHHAFSDWVGLTRTALTNLTERRDYYCAEVVVKHRGQKGHNMLRLKMFIQIHDVWMVLTECVVKWYNLSQTKTQLEGSKRNEGETWKRPTTSNCFIKSRKLALLCIKIHILENKTILPRVIVDVDIII